MLSIIYIILSKYEARTLKCLEICSELLLHLVTIFLTLFNDLSLSHHQEIELITLSMIGFLFLINLIYMAFVLVHDTIQKRRKKILSEKKAVHAAKLSAKQIKESWNERFNVRKNKVFDALTLPPILEEVSG